MIWLDSFKKDFKENSSSGEQKQFLSVFLTEFFFNFEFDMKHCLASRTEFLPILRRHQGKFTPKLSTSTFSH
jgi:hypothetical protein